MYGSRVETSAASARPPIGSRLRASATVSSTDASFATATARIAPASRSLSTRLRVSTPVSATTPVSSSQSVHAGPRASRISTARACGRDDSERPPSTP
jgi:hypothetical protein